MWTRLNARSMTVAHEWFTRQSYILEPVSRPFQLPIRPSTWVADDIRCPGCAGPRRMARTKKKLDIHARASNPFRKGFRLCAPALWRQRGGGKKRDRLFRWELPVLEIARLPLKLARQRTIGLITRHLSAPRYTLWVSRYLFHGGSYPTPLYTSLPVFRACIGL